MNDRTGQVWDVRAYMESVDYIYLVLGSSWRCEGQPRCKMWALCLGTGERTTLQELDGMQWEHQENLVRLA